MKTKNSRIFLFAFFLLQVSAVFSQIDTAFWFAVGWVTPDHTPRSPYKVHLAGPSGTTIRLRQPAAIAPNKYDTTITIPASGLFDYIFWRDATPTNSPYNRGYDSLEVRPADVVVPYGLYISSTANITAVWDYVTQAPDFLNTETFSMKGQNGMGMEFITPFQTIYRNMTLGGDLPPTGSIEQPRQQINICATAPNTTVWITPRTNVVGHPANITYSVYLPSPGSAYTCENIVQNTYVPGNNLSGSLISSSKPITVNVTDDSVNSLSAGCYDLMGDQIVPIDIVGTDYIMNRGQLQAGMQESGYIVGTENFTQLNIIGGGTVTALINKGETYRYQLNSPLTYVNSSKPVYLIHASGYGCELGEAILPPLSCAGSSLVAFSRNSNQLFSLNILCKDGAQNSFTLNNAVGGVNVPIPAGNFSMVPGTNLLPGGPFWGTQLNLNSPGTLPVGGYTIANTSPNTAIREFALGVFDGGTGSGGLFHYMSSFLRRTAVDNATLAPVCAGVTNTVALTGTISGAALTGYWSTNGTGTIDPVYTSTLGVVSTVYTLSPFEASTTVSLSLTFSLTSIGCSPKTTTTSLTINPLPIVSVGTSTSYCKNNVPTIALTGTVLNSVGGGVWTGGNGGAFGIPGANTTYTPSQADINSGLLTLTLTSSGPFAGCINTSQTLTYTFTNPPTVSAGGSTVICTNSQSLILMGSVNGFTNVGGTWSTTGSGIFVPDNSSPTATYVLSIADVSLTNITFSLSGSSPGCAMVTATTAANIIPKPVVNAGPDKIACASSSISILSGTISGAATTGFWTTPDGSGTFPPPNGVPTATYVLGPSDPTTGTLTIVLNSDPGTCPVATDTLRMLIVSDPSITVNTNTTLCDNANIVCSGTITGAVTSGSWTAFPGGGTFNPSNTSLNTIYIPSSQDIANGFIVISLYPDPGQCGNGPPKSFTATVINSPMAMFSIPALGRCLGSPVTFTDTSLPNGSSSLTYSWNFGDGPLSISSTTNPIYTYTSAGSYVITLTVTGSNNCPDTVSRRVTIAPNPISEFSVRSSCEGINSDFLSTSQAPSGGGAINTLIWQWGDGSPVTVLTGGTFTNSAVHVYTVPNQFVASLTASTTLGCSATSSQVVNVNQQPNAEFGMTNNPTVAQEPVYFSDFSTPPQNLVNWYWQFGDEGTSSEQGPSHSYINAGIYVIKLTITDNKGCSDTISKSIDVNLLPQVPTAFTPNNDFNNDLLFVKGGPFEKMRFRVYNNWGEMLFETTDQKIGWDGMKDGKEQPVGVYVWTLEVDMYNNRQVRKNGDVTLIR